MKCYSSVVITRLVPKLLTEIAAGVGSSKEKFNNNKICRAPGLEFSAGQLGELNEISDDI